MNYFLDEIGIDSEKAASAASDLGDLGGRALAGMPGSPVAALPPATAQARTVGFWPPPVQAGAPTDVESFAQVVRSVLPSVVNVSTENRFMGGQPAAFAPPLPVGGQPPAPGIAPPSIPGILPATPGVPQAPVAAPGPDGTGGLRFANPFSGVAMESIGSGVVISADGYIVSNFHVVENSRNVFVTVFGTQGSQRYPAEVVRLDPLRDLVLLKIPVTMPLQPAPLGNSDLVQVGDPVITVGCPFGLDQTVSKGIVSGSRKAVTIEGVVHKDLIQTDAAINQGNSGGPLVSRFGYVVGINTAIYSPTQAFSGVGFAVPVNSVREFITETIAIPEVTPAMAGAPGAMAALPGSAAPGQAIAARRTSPPPIPANAVSPHEDRGPCENCHVVQNSGQLVHQPGAVSPALGGATGINVALPVTTSIGAVFRPLDEVLIQRFQPPFASGIFVQSVVPGSPAEAGGLLVGDILFKVDGRWVRSPEEFQGRLAGYAVGDSLRLSVVRERARLDLTISLAPPTGQTAAAVPEALSLLSQGPVTAMGSLAAPGVAPVPGAAAPAPNGDPATGGLPQAGGQAAMAKPPVPTEFEWFGMELQPIDAAMMTKTPALKDKVGAVVLELDPGLQADTAGLRGNDIVVAINSLPVSSNAELDSAIKAVATARTIILDVERDGKRMFVTLQ
ncbi:MAG: trypsin-like peptidase domain-containing protein [Magnetococcales bacterium]|nr:trypsin-like peptidase domain-containing protein [Magnetococcales bacterium]